MSYRILIVDDSAAMRAFVKRVIELSGFALAGCLQASNGVHALEVLRTERVDAILTDINMPLMDGEEFLRRVEADESLRNIPAVIISTDGTDTRIQRMMGLGARGYVKKPFRPEDLRAELERCLEVRQ